MKKLLSLVIIAISAGCMSVFAQNLTDWVNNLSTTVSFGYSASQKIAVANITNQTIIIQSPLIKNSSGTAILRYNLMYGEYPLTDILSKPDLYSQTQTKKIDLTGAQDPFTIQIGTSDGLNTTKKYYAFIIPIAVENSAENMGDVSNEIRFKLGENVYGEGETTGAQQTTLENTHAAAGADMSLTNITHTLNGNTITLKRTAIAGSNNIDILVLDTNTNSFSKVGNVSMSQESYSYTATRNGDYTFQLIPDNGGRASNYTLSVQGVQETRGGTTPTSAKLTKIPNTGTTENIIAILIITGILYIMVKRSKSKAKSHR